MEKAPDRILVLKLGKQIEIQNAMGQRNRELRQEHVWRKTEHMERRLEHFLHFRGGLRGHAVLYIGRILPWGGCLVEMTGSKLMYMEDGFVGEYVAPMKCSTLYSDEQASAECPEERSFEDASSSNQAPNHKGQVVLSEDPSQTDRKA